MSVAEELEANPVLRKDRDGVARLTLNRPKAYNALSLGLMAALQDELKDIAADRSIKAVVIEGAGKGFCAGHDLREMRSRTDETLSPDSVRRVLEADADAHGPASNRLLPKSMASRPQPAANSLPLPILPSPPMIPVLALPVSI